MNDLNFLAQIEHLLRDMRDAATDGDEPGFHVGDTITDWARRLEKVAEQLRASEARDGATTEAAAEARRRLASGPSKGAQLTALLNIVTEMTRDPMGPSVTLSKQDLATLISQLRPVSGGRETEIENITRRLVQASDTVGRLAKSAEETRDLPPAAGGANSQESPSGAGRAPGA